MQASEQAGKIRELRELLAEKFPQAPARDGGGFPVPMSTGEPPVELRRGVVTEASGPAGSGALFLEHLIASAHRERAMLALIDGAGSFDPVGEPLNRLLWVFCKEAEVAVKAADLLLRDGNLPLVVLDLQLNSLAELRRIPASTWYRLQRIVEPTMMAFVVLTPRPMVNSAAQRLFFSREWSLHALRQRRAELTVGPSVRRMGTMIPMDRQIA